MKRKLILTLSIAVIAAICIVPVMVGCTDRSAILRVYNCDDYINPEVYDQFEKYYAQVTGNKIEVVEKTFATNEEMLTEIAAAKADYDVICPSDYMIERMAKDNLLIELESDLTQYGKDVVDYRGNISDSCKGLPFDPENKYSAVYMWGTMGILYNKALLHEEHRADTDNSGHPDFVESWSALWDASYPKDQKARVWMKNSMRDTYAVGAIYTFAKEIESGAMTVAEALNATAPEQISRVENNLLKQKKHIYGYEVEEGKQEAVDGLVAMTLQWGGDAIWSIYDAAENENNPVELNYSIPKEGSNKFFDGWCIPKYASNVPAAQLFVNFMCKPESAIANMDYIGYTSAVATDEVVDYLNENFADFPERDLSYFFGGDVPFMVKADPRQFPDPAELERCAVMVDFGDRNEEIIKMWNRVRAD